MFQGDVAKIKMHTFNKHICRDNSELTTVINYSGVISYSFYRTFVLEFDVFCQVFDETEFAELAQFRFCFILKHRV